jgi:hypothetical protein
LKAEDLPQSLVDCHKMVILCKRAVRDVKEHGRTSEKNNATFARLKQAGCAGSKPEASRPRKAGKVKITRKTE